MGFITPAVVVLLFLIIIFVTLILTATVSEGGFGKSYLRTFTSVLIALGIFITFAFYFSVIELQQEQQRLSIVNQTARLNEHVTGLYEAIKENYTYIPHFASSLIPLSGPTLTSADPLTPETQLRIYTLAQRVFTIWEEVELATGFLDFDPAAYIARFLQCATSVQLQTQWLMQRLHFSSSVQRFGDTLFEHAAQIQQHDVDAYQTQAQRVVQVLASK